MSGLRLSPATLESGYEFLRTTAPFKGWRLPEPDGVAFVVSRSRLHRAQFVWDAPPRLEVSERFVSHTATLMALIAHEMVHLRLWLKGGDRVDVHHSAAFLRDWAAVCRHHGFDQNATGC
jgi:hypothetical protein